MPWTVFGLRQRKGPSKARIVIRADRSKQSTPVCQVTGDARWAGEDSAAGVHQVLGQGVDLGEMGLDGDGYRRGSFWKQMKKRPASSSPDSGSMPSAKLYPRRRMAWLPFEPGAATRMWAAAGMVGWPSAPTA